MYIIGTIVFLFDVCFLLFPISLAQAQRTQQALVPASQAGGVVRISSVMYNPFAPLNLYEILAGLVMLSQTIAALSISLLVANGFVWIEDKHNAGTLHGGRYIPIIAAVVVLIVCLWTNVWSSVASGISGALLICALFNRARFLDAATSTINTNYVNYAWLIIPLGMVFLTRWFSVLQIPLASAGCGIYGFTLAFMPYRVVWTDNFVLVWSMFLLCGWQLVYSYTVFPLIIRWYYNRQLRKGVVSPTVQFLTISIWGDSVLGEARPLQA